MPARMRVLPTHTVLQAARHVDNVLPSKNVFKAVGNVNKAISIKSADSKENESMRQSKIIDIVCYALFMFFFTLNTIDGLGDESAYKFTSRLSTTLGITSFESITEPNDLIDWLADDFVDTLYSENFEGTSNTSAATGWIMQGPARVAQWRSKTYDCSADVHALLKDYTYECTYNRKLTYMNSGFNEEYESSASFRGFTYNNAQVEKVQKQRDRRYTSVTTSVRHSWPAPAFAVLIDPHGDYATAQATALTLRTNRYIDTQTNGLAVDLSVYNYILNMHVWVRYMCEFNAAGGVDCMATLEPQRLFWVPDTYAYKMFLQVMVALGYMYFTGRLVLTVRRLGWRASFHRMMFWVQLTNVALYLIQLGYRYESYSLFAGGGFASSSLGRVDFTGSGFVDMSSTITALRYSVTLQSINTFLNWFKLVNYLSTYPVFALMTKTLDHSFEELMAFSIVFCVIMFGFAQAHAMMFGRQLSNYRTMVDSFMTLFRAMLGDFNFLETYEIHYVIGPLFFLSFVGIAFLVVLNIIIAIIADGYVEANAARKIELEKRNRAKAARRKDKLAMKLKLQASKKATMEGVGTAGVVEEKDEAALMGIAAFAATIKEEKGEEEEARAVPTTTKSSSSLPGRGAVKNDDDLEVSSVASSSPYASRDTSGDEAPAPSPPAAPHGGGKREVSWIRMKQKEGGSNARVAPESSVVVPIRATVGLSNKDPASDEPNGSKYASWEEL